MIIITGILILVMMVIIFIFSTQNVNTSDSLSGSITRIIMKLMKAIQKLFPNQGGSDIPYDPNYSFFDDLNHYVRKLAHITEFALLGASVTGHIFACLKRKEGRFNVIKGLMCLVIGFLYACTDELHQLFVEGRGAQFKDVLIDTFGVLMGITIVYVIDDYVNKRKTKS